MQLRVSLGLAALAVVSVVAPTFAQEEEPQVVRQDLMDEIGDATGVMGNMVRGRTDYDRDAIIEALAVIEQNAAQFVEYFPEDSQTGFETEALPAIWENKDDFNERAETLSADAAELAGMVPQTLEEFAPMFQDFAGNCGDCHDEYRQSDD